MKPGEGGKVLGLRMAGAVLIRRQGRVDRVLHAYDPMTTGQPARMEPGYELTSVQLQAPCLPLKVRNEGSGCRGQRREC